MAMLYQSIYCKLINGFLSALLSAFLLSLLSYSGPVYAQSAPDAGTHYYDTQVNESIAINESDLLADQSDDVYVKTVGSSSKGDVDRGRSQITFTPGTGYVGTASFSYTLANTAGEDLGWIHVRVQADPDNSLPLAQDDHFSTGYGEAIDISKSDILANDTDSDGDPLSIDRVMDVENGVAEMYRSAIRFIPDDSGESGQFEYVVVDGRGGQAKAYVKINIEGGPDPDPDPDPNRPPYWEDGAQPKQFNGPQGQVIDGNPNDLIAGAIDPDGDGLGVIEVGEAEHGDVELYRGTVRYTPPSDDFVGSDTFIYTLSDGQGGDLQGQVEVTIYEVSEDDNSVLHEAEDGDYRGTIKTEYGGTGRGYVDLSGKPTFIVWTVPIAVDGLYELRVRYALKNNASDRPMNLDIDGETVTTFDFEETDGWANWNDERYYHEIKLTAGSHAIELHSAGSKSGPNIDHLRVTLLEAYDNQAPTAKDLAYETIQNQALEIKTIDLINEASDPEGDDLGVPEVYQGQYGEAVLNRGTIVFTPEQNYIGDEAYFDYKVDDGHEHYYEDETQQIGRIRITVSPEPDPDDPAEVIIYEAEHADYQTGGHQIADNHCTDSSPCSNDAFIDMLGEGPLIWSVPIDTHGRYRLVFRYALSKGARPLDLKLNGEVIAEKLPFPKSGSWKNWVDQEYELELTSGRHIIELMTTGNSGANIDYLGVQLLEAINPNEAPKARDHAFELWQDTTLELKTVDLFDPEIDDPEQDDLGVTQISNGINGTATLYRGTITFTPDEGFIGIASFQYTINDGYHPNCKTCTGNVEIEVYTPDHSHPNFGDDESQYFEGRGGRMDADRLETTEDLQSAYRSWLPDFLAPSVEVGSIPGTLSVGPNGDAQYTIPIHTPPGSNGMQPKLFLNYSSHGGDSIAGYGWSISAPPKIQRCIRWNSLPIDPIPYGPLDDGYLASAYDMKHAWCLGDKPLIKVGYKGPKINEHFYPHLHLSAGEYRTQPDSFARVVVEQAEVGTPPVVKVYYKNGLVQTYSDSIEVQRPLHNYELDSGVNVPEGWGGHHPNNPSPDELISYEPSYVLLPTQTEDRFGNTIHYDWWPNISSLRLHKIRYANDKRRIEFEYSNSTKQAVYKMGPGGLVKDYDRRLTGIHLYHKQNKALTYKLDYERGQRSQRYRLKHIKLCDYNDRCMPPLQFNYTDSDPEQQWSQRPEHYFDGSNGLTGILKATPKRATTYVMDINGDGADDLIWRAEDVASIGYWRARTSVFNHSTDVYDSDELQQNVLSELPRIGGQVFKINGYRNTYGLLTLDASGILQRWQLQNNDAQTWRSTQLEIDHPGYSFGVTADINGDGFVDFVGCRKTTLDQLNAEQKDWISDKNLNIDDVGHWELLLNRPGYIGLKMGNTMLNNGNYVQGAFCGPSKVMVMNGVAVQEPQETMSLVSFPAQSVGIFEPPLASFGGVDLNNGISNTVISKYTFGSVYTDGYFDQSMLFGDFNGDGIGDSIKFDDPRYGDYCEISMGAYPFGLSKTWRGSTIDFKVTNAEVWQDESPSSPYYLPMLKGFSHGGDNYTSDRHMVLDYNGDGRSDVLYRASELDRGWRYFTLDRRNINDGPRDAIESDGWAYQSDPADNIPNDIEQLYSGDFDGDGQTDLLMLGDDDRFTIQLRARANHPYPVTGERTLQPTVDLLASVRNGYGVREDIRYAPMTDPSVVPSTPQSGDNTVINRCHFYDGQCLAKEVIDGRAIVKEIKSELSNERHERAALMTYYRYYKPSRDFRTGNWLGFAKLSRSTYRSQQLAYHEVIELQNDIVVDLTPAWDKPDTDHRRFLYAGRPWRTTAATRVQTAIDQVEYVIEQTDNRYGIKFDTQHQTGLFEPLHFIMPVHQKTTKYKASMQHVLNYLDNGQYLPTGQFLHMVSSEICGWSGSEKFDINNVDEFGNVSCRRHIDNSQEHHTTINRTYVKHPDALNAWQIALPESQSTTVAVYQADHWHNEQRFSTFRYWDYCRRGPCAYPSGVPFSVRLQGSPDGEAEYTTNYDYDQYGNVDHVTRYVRERSEVLESQIRWDEDGIFPLQVTNNYDHYQKTLHDPVFGKLKYLIDSNDRETLIQYDSFGRRVYLNAGNGSTERILRHRVHSGDHNTPSALWVEHDLPGHGYSQQYYNRMGELQRSHSKGLKGKDITQFYLYNFWGQQIARSLPQEGISDQPGDVAWYRSDHNLLGQPLRVIFPNGRLVDYRYNLRPENMVTHIEDRGDTTVHQFQKRDYTGKLLASKQGTQPYRCFSYDPNERLRASWSSSASDGIIDGCLSAPPQAGSTHYTNNRFGLTNQIDDPALGVRRYSYDGAGQLIWSRDAKDQVNTYQYDALGRTQSRSRHPGDSANTWIYVWDQGQHGALSGIQGPNQQQSNTYDRWGRIRSVESRFDSDESGKSYFTHYDYDYFGRGKGVQYPQRDQRLDRMRFLYQYDEFGHLYAADQYRFKNSRRLWEALGTNAMGQITIEAFGDDDDQDSDPKWVVRNYDTHTGKLNLVTAVKPLQHTYYQQQYSYTQRGLLKTRKSAEQIETFDYDEQNQLVETIYENGGSRAVYQNYVYDPFGNLTQKGDTRLYYESVYNNPRALTQINDDFEIAYDANGNQINRNGTIINYDAHNQVNRIISSEDTIRYRYNAAGQKIERVSDAYDMTSRYLGGFQHDDQLNGDLYQYKLTINGRPVAQLSQHLTKHANHLNKNTHWLDTNKIGSLTATLSGDEDNSIKQFHFTAFGERRRSDDWMQASEHDITEPVNLGFGGHKAVLDDGLVNMNGRHYDPLSGRFISPDPFMAEPQNTLGWNRYAYVGNNPLNRTDPSGYFPVDVGEGDTMDIFATFIAMGLSFALGVDVGQVAEQNGLYYTAEIPEQSDNPSATYSSTPPQWSHGATESYVSVAKPVVANADYLPLATSDFVEDGSNPIDYLITYYWDVKDTFPIKEVAKSNVMAAAFMIGMSNSIEVMIETYNLWLEQEYIKLGLDMGAAAMGGGPGKGWKKGVDETVAWVRAMFNMRRVGMSRDLEGILQILMARLSMHNVRIHKQVKEEAYEGTPILPSEVIMSLSKLEEVTLKMARAPDDKFVVMIAPNGRIVSGQYEFVAAEILNRKGDIILRYQGGGSPEATIKSYDDDFLIDWIVEFIE